MPKRVCDTKGERKMKTQRCVIAAGSGKEMLPCIEVITETSDVGKRLW